VRYVFLEITLDRPEKAPIIPPGMIKKKLVQTTSAFDGLDPHSPELFQLSREPQVALFFCHAPVGTRKKFHPTPQGKNFTFSPFVFIFAPLFFRRGLFLYRRCDAETARFD
jgi:hypothetical protein